MGRLIRKPLIFHSLNGDTVQERLSGKWIRVRIRKIQRCVCCLRTRGKDEYMWRPTESQCSFTVNRVDRACDDCVGRPLSV